MVIFKNEGDDSAGDEFFESVGSSTNSTSSTPRNDDGDDYVEDASDALQSGKISMKSNKWACTETEFWSAPKLCEPLPSGMYRGEVSSDKGPFLIRQDVKTDSLLVLPDTIMTSVIKEFEFFWASKQRFTQRGFLHKRGFIFWGPPGSGKSSLIQLLVKKLSELYGGITFLVNHPKVAQLCLEMIRRVEPERPIIAVLEDIDSLVTNHGESSYLAMLDGEVQVDNIVYIATTNYPDRLDPRFVDRPSRFDKIIKLGMPSAAARHEFLKVKEPSLTNHELEHWVKKTNEFSLAHLRELLIAVKCLEQDFDEVIERIGKMKNKQAIKKDGSVSIGFGT